MTFENVNNHNSLIAFFRENGLEVSDDIEQQDHAMLSLAYKENGKTLAAATLSLRYNVYILDYIAVDETLRRSGIGAKILKEILREAKKLNVKKVYLTAKNPYFFKSQGFYEGAPDGVDMNADCAGCPEYNNGCTKLPMVIDL